MYVGCETQIPIPLGVNHPLMQLYDFVDLIPVSSIGREKLEATRWWWNDKK